MGLEGELLTPLCHPPAETVADASFQIGFFFAGISALWWIPCYFLFPEVSPAPGHRLRSRSVLCWVIPLTTNLQTQGRTYAELDELYASGVPVRKFASVRTKAQDALQGEQAPSA